MKQDNYPNTPTTRFSRWMLFAGIAMLSLFAMSATAQVSVTATAGDTGPTAYTTVNAAFTAINAGTHQGDITVTITGNTTEPSTPVPLLKSASPSSYTSVLITPSGDVTINSAASPATNRGIIELAGADNVTIDGDDPGTAGDRNLTIQSVASATAGIACVRLSSNSTTGLDGADNNTVKNCIIIGSRNSATSTTNNYGIQFSNGISTSSSSTGAYSSLNTIIQNNVITRTYRGVHAYGSSSTYPNTGTQILNNIIGSSTSTDNIGFRGILIQYSAVSSGGAIISGNDISVGDLGSTGYSQTIAGIEVGTSNYGISILGNNIHDINSPSTSGYGAHGILVTGSTNNTLSTIANNFIRDCKMVVYQTSATSTFIPTGVFFTAGATGVNFIHNTVSMGTQLGSGSNFSSFCVNSSVSGVRFTEFTNNILVNSHASTTAYCLYTANTLNISGGNVNNNNYYAPSANVGYYNATAATTLGDWQTATGKDGASLNINPPFTSATDLHIPASTSTTLESSGVTSSITTDYDGDSRPSGGLAVAPDIGADEFDGSNPSFCSGTPTAGSISGASAVCSGTSTTLSLSGASTEAGISYQWASSTTMGGPYTDLGTDPTQNTGALTVETYYICTLTCSNGGGTASTSEYTVGITAPPSVAVSPGYGVICSPGGSAVSLTASGADSYSWSPSTGLSADTGAAVDANPSLNTTYVVTGLDSSTFCSATSSVEITVAGVPSVTATATPDAVCNGANSQLAAVGSPTTIAGNYLFSYGFGASLDPMSGASTIISSGADDNVSTVQNIGFDFVFDGVTYTQFTASADGWLYFGNTTTTQYSNSVTSTTNVPKVYPLWDDLATGTDGSVQALVTGTAPNRILVVQWFVTIPRNTTGAATSTYQVWLYEGSNNIEFRYGTMGASASSSCGITGASASSYMSLTFAGNTVSNTSANNSNTGAPASGTIYTFSPGDITYAWTPTDFLNDPSAQNPEAQSVTATTMYTVVPTNNGCDGTGANVTVSLASPVSVAVNSPTICSGESVTLTAVPTDGGAPITYDWTPATDLSATTGISVDASPTSTIDYTVTATDACATTASAIATVTVNPTPSASITPAGPIVDCSDNPTQLTSSTSASSPTYQWMLNGSDITVGGTSANYTPSVSGDYVVVITDGSCNSTSNIVSVTINPSPSAMSITPSSSAICQGGSQALSAAGGTISGTLSNSVTINMTNQATDEDGGVSGASGYICPGLNLVGSFTLPAIPGGALGAHLTINGISLSGGSYGSEVRLHFSGSGISGSSPCFQGATSSGTPNPVDWVTGASTAGDTATLAALLNPAGGTVDIYYSEAYNDITSGQDATFPATATLQYYYNTPAPIITWTPAASGLDTYTGANVTASPSVTTEYTATATSLDGCTSSATATVDVSTLSVSGTPTDASCYGVSDGSIDASGSGGTPAYEYSLDGSTWQSGTTFSGLAAGSYTLYIKDAEPCTTSVSVVVGSPAQLVVTASNDGPVCDGSDVTLTATGGFVSYSWTGPNSYSDNVNPSTITGATLAATGTYTVTVSDGSCTETATTDVIINAVGVAGVSLAADANPSCDGVSVTYTATPTNGGASPTYEFFVNYVSVQNGASDTYSYVPVNNDTIYVVMTSTACASGNPATSNEIYQTVNSNPAAPTITPGGPTTFCANIGSVTLTSSYTGGNTWSTAETTDAITVNTSGSYTVTYTDGNGCSATSAAEVVTANTSSVAITSSNPGGLCTGATVTLTADATPVATDYLWNTTETTQAIDITTSGTYDVTTTDANGCTATNSIVVSDVAVPTASISGNATICTGTIETLTASATAGSGTIDTYQWVLNGSTNVGTNSATYDATVAGSYTVIVTNSNGCSVTSAAHVLGTTGPLSGTYTISTNPASCTNYTSIAAAIGDLNTLGVAGNVTFDIEAGYTETAPAGGYLIDQCALAANLKSGPTQTVTFQKSGAGANPLITAFTPGTSTTTDGVIKIVGVDNITFDQIDIQENAANTTATELMEMAVGVYKCNGNDGSVNVTFQNGNVSLNKANTGAIAFRSANTTATSTSSLTYTGLAGDPDSVQASMNRVNILNNTISNVYGATLLTGNTASSAPYSLNDTLHVVSGNTITDFGGGTATATIISITDSRGFTIANNSVNGGTGQTGTIYGINGGSGPHGTITGNTVTLTPANTSNSVYGINYGASGTGNMATVTHNIVENCTTASATSATFYSMNIGASGTDAFVRLDSNIVRNNSHSGTGTFYGVYLSSSPTNASMQGNEVSGNARTGTGTSYLLYFSTPANLTHANNTVINNTIAGGAATCTMYCMYGSTSKYTLSNNLVENNGVLSMTGTSTATVYGYYNLGSPTEETITNNTIRRLYINGTTTGSNTIRGMYQSTTSATGAFRIYESNSIDSLYTPVGVSANIAGIYSSTGNTVTISKNRIYRLLPGQSTGTSSAKGIVITSGTAVTAKNNLINVEAFGTPVLTANTALTGIEITGGTSMTLQYNTVRVAGGGSGTAFGSSGISITSTTPNVTLNNNLVLNMSGAGGGTAAASAVALRRSSSALTSYNTASNNNIYYAGAASASHLLYYDGTNSDQTLAAFKARVTPRESSSRTENTGLLSTVGTDVTFLHVDAGVANQAESGGIAIAGIDDDYDGDIRQGSVGYAGTGTAPDIGADEFNGTSVAPVLANLSVSPLGSCSAVSHTVTVDATTAIGTIDSVKVFYSYGATVQTPITSTVPSSGNTYSFTLPAASPTNAIVSWYVTAYNSGGFSATLTGTAYQDDYLNGTIMTASASPAGPICSGDSTTLNASIAGTATVGAGSLTTSSYQSPWYHLYGGLKDQFMISAADLNAAGISAGDLTSVAFEVVAVGTTYNSFEIQVGVTTNSALTTSLLTGLSSVYTAGALTLTAGINTFNFSTPFYWNGTSNLVIQTCWSNNNTGGTSATVKYDATSYVSNAYYRADSQTDAVICGTNSGTGTNSGRPKMVFGYNQISNFTTSWSDGSSTIGSGSSLVISPTSSTAYTVTATDVNGCTLTAISDTVFVLPIPAAPLATDSTQCGNGVPSCYVQGTTGATFNWYDAAVGGNLLQSGLDTTYLVSINATTTWYVSEVGTNGCPGDRVAVTQTVTQPDAIDAQSTFTSICPGESIDLSVIQTGSTNNYDYTWTAQPSAGSGISGTLIGNPVSTTPTIPGTYNFVVTAVDGPNMCTIQDSVYVTVNNVPTITSVAAVPDTVCAGYPVVLTALTPEIGAGSVPVGTATTTVGSDYSNFFYSLYSNQRDQVLFKASELLSAGMYAGDITSISFELTAVGTLPMSDFSVHIGHTAFTSVTSGTWETGLTQTYTNASYTPVLGVNTITFSTPFTWNGTSNIILQTCWGNSGSSATTSGYTIRAQSPGFTCLNNAHPAAATAGSAVCVNTTTYLTYSTRPWITFGAITQSQGAGTYTWDWQPGSLSGNEVTDNPTTTTNYTVTATDPGTGCTNSATVNVVVNPTPPAPTAFDGGHCGNQTPTCYVTRSQAGTTFNWYFDAVGGSPIAGQNDSILVSYPRNQQDTFYVAEVYATGPCEGPRVMVVENITIAEAITATATVPNDTICPFGTVTLDATQGTVTTYTSYDWTTIPAGGTASGQNTTASAPNTPGQVIWKVVASDGTCVTEAYDTIYVTAPPVISSVTSDIDSVCPGTSVVLTALTPVIANDTIRIGSGTSGFSGAANPYYRNDEGFKAEFLIRASDLTAAGLFPGDITELSNYVTSSGATPNNLDGYTIRMAHTTATTLSTTFQTASFTTVFGPVNYSPVAGLNIHTFSTPFTWDGTSNILITVCYDNDPLNNSCTSGSPICYGNSLSIWYNSGVGYNAAHYYTADNTSSTLNRNMCDTSGTLGSTQTNLPRFGFRGQVGTYGAGIVDWTWNPGGATTNQITVNPTSTTTYTVTAGDPSPGGCYNEATITVFVHPEPLAPTNPVDLVQCGTGIPLISVTRSGDPSDSFMWYTVSSGGTPIAGETDSVLTAEVVNTTTTFYVSEFNGYCEGPRTAVTVTVNQPDGVSINASDTSVCLPSPVITLDAIQSGSTSSYVYTWDIQPNGTSGQSGTSGASITMEPTAAGTYTVTVTAVDAGASCTTVAEKIIEVNEYPVITTVSAVPDTVCAGSPVDLSAQSIGLGQAAGNIGTGTSGVSSTYMPYYRTYEGHKSQHLYLASELSAAGFVAGPITKISMEATAVTLPNDLNGFTISIGQTSATALTTTWETGLTTVYGPTNFSPALGMNDHPFSSAFVWDGVSNIVVQTCFDNDPLALCGTTSPTCWGNSTSAKYTSSAGFTASHYWYADNDVAGYVRNMCDTTYTGFTSSARPNMTFTGVQTTDISSNYSWNWEPGSLAGNNVTVNPTSTTTYTVTATIGACSDDTTVTVVVNPLPATPTASNSIQCGYGTPTCSVSGGAGDFYWYNDSTSSAFLPGQSGTSLIDYPISETDTFWVSENNGVCESGRVMVIAEVTPVDTVTATISADTICLGSSADLMAVQTGGIGNSYAYTWTVSPDTSVSGITGSASGSSVTITPTAAGTYVYTVNSVDGSCNATPSSVTLFVGDLPSVDVGPDITVCDGGTITLTANSPNFIPTLRWTELMVQGWITSGYSGFTPAYITVPSGTTEDIWEVTNLGTGPADPSGVTFEHWSSSSTTAPSHQKTVPSGAPLIPSGGSLFLMANTSNPTDDIANNVYRFDAATLNIGSGTAGGYIIRKDGLIIDAVAVNGYTFPAASGVTPADWSGNIPSNSGQNGSVLISDDNNTNTCWAVTGTAGPKSSYGTVNPGVNVNLPPTGSVSWTSIPAGFVGNTAQVLVGPITSNTTYIATVSNDYGCAVSDSINVTVVTSPGVAVITASADTVCGTGSVTLSASGLAQGATIQWQSSPSGLVDTWTNVGTDSVDYNTGVISSSTYYRLYATCSGTDTSASVFIFVANPTVSGTDTSRCGVGVITLLATSNGDVSWFTGSAGGTALFTGNPYEPILTATTTFWLQASIGTCVNSVRVPVTATLNAAPSVDFTTSADSVCDGTSITLTATSTNTDYTYYWSTTDSTIEFTGNPYVLTPSASANYYLLAVDSSGNTYNLCGAYAGPKPVVVNPQPITPVVSPSMTTVCTAGDSTLLTVSNAPAVSAGFADVGTGTVTNATTSTTNMPPYGNYYTGNKHQMLVLASDLQALGMAPGPITSLAFDVVSNGGVLSYNGFTIKMGHTSATSLSTAFEASPSTTVWTGAAFSPTAGWYTHNFTTPFVWDGVSNVLIETYFSNCTGSATCSGVTCSGYGSGTTYSQNAVTNQSNTAYVSHSYWYGDSDGCSPEVNTTADNAVSVLPNMRFGAQVGSSILYTWNPGGQTGSSVYVTPTASTIYTVTASIGPCSASGTAQVDYTPVNLVITPSGPTTFCGSGTVSLDAGGPYASYSWNPGGETTQVITVNPTSSATYTVTVDSGACTVSQTIDLTVYPDAPINITPSSTAAICGGAGSIVLTADAGYTNYLWSPGGETTDAITVSPASTTDYTVTALDGNGCSQTGVYTVTSYPAPATPVITPGGPETLCWDGVDGGTFITFTADTTGAGAGATIAWNDIFGSVDPFIDVYAIDYGMGPQTFTITVTNSFNCQATASVDVLIDPCASGVSLDLKLFLEGYYLGGGTMYSTLYDLEQGAILTGPYNPDATDTIEVNLWSASSLSNPGPDYSEKVILTSNGTTSVNFPTATAGYYYIAIRHKNTIETWSKDTVSLSSTAILYDFSDSLTKAFDDGFNAPMQNMGGGVYAFYSGDVNQDGTVDGSDMNDVYNDNNLFLYDYLVTDCTGDGTADGQDMNIVYNNNNLFLFYARPY